MEEILISAMLSGQRNITIGNVNFENMPILRRDTQAKREAQARKEAQKLIEILNSED